METILLPHLPDHPLFAALYQNVQNASFLRQQLLNGNTDFEYAFLDASMVLSREQALAACFRAISDMTNHRMKSRNVHSEIVFSFSPNNNIAESFRRFGISDDTKHVLAIKVRTSVSVTAEGVAGHLHDHVHGQTIEFSQNNLSEMADLARIRKIYKYSSPAHKDTKSTLANSEAEFAAMNSFVVGTMALKGS